MEIKVKNIPFIATTKQPVMHASKNDVNKNYNIQLHWYITNATGFLCHCAHKNVRRNTSHT